MSLEDYCRREGLDRLWDRLKTWYDGLDGEWRFRLVRRNIDREFGLREDLDSSIKQAFLDTLAAMWETLEEEEHPRFRTTYEALNRPHPLRFSPPNVIKKVVQARPGDFLLKGRPVRSRSAFVFRYVELKKFVDNLDLSRISLPREYYGMRGLARDIRDRKITGAHVETLSWTPSRPLWCTDDSLASETDPDTMRDRLGLQHVDGGWLLEIRYPYSLLSDQGLALPTILDASGGKGVNWLFNKNKHPGGPDWGHTVDMSDERGRGGVPEAVHPLPSPPADPGRAFELRVLGEVSGPQKMKGALMLANGAL